MGMKGNTGLVDLCSNNLIAELFNYKVRKERRVLMVCILC